jgi:hypothetical protein
MFFSSSTHVRLLRSAALPILALVVLVASPATLNAQSAFIRGDGNGDGVVDATDLDYVRSFLFGGGPQLVNACGGGLQTEIADVNDNEYLTIADPLRIAAALFFGGALIDAPYPACGPDPINQTYGFDQIDPAYTVELTGPYDGTGLLGARTARFDLAVSAPDIVSAVELYFTYDPAVLMNPRYEGALGLSAVDADFGVVRFFLDDPLAPLGLPVGTSSLGGITFDVAPGTFIAEIDWLPGFASGLMYRGTVVDSGFADHHPQFVETPIPLFTRGDVFPNGSLSSADLSSWMLSYSGLVPPQVSGCDGGLSEARDVNDNEYVTIADFLLLNDYLFCSGTSPVPAPNACGADPDDSDDGFGTVDPAFAIRAANMTLFGAGPVERDVEIQLLVLTPEPLRAVSFNLEFGTSALTLGSPYFVPAATLTDPLDANLQAGSRASVVIASGCEPLVAAGSPQWQELGILRLHLAGTALPAPIEWLPEAELNGIVYRATAIGLDFRDHHPRLLAGERDFQRGNANNGGAVPVDIADPIFILGYLLSGGAFPPCLDAADSNDDGNIDISDAIYILSYLIGSLPPMPTPFPACGFEFDIDELDCDSYNCL